jgi:Tfp pilus assembly protein PilN
MSQQINLFNPIFLKQKKLFSALALFQVFGLVLFGAVLMAIYATYQASELKKSAAIVSAQLQSAEALVARVRVEAVAPATNKALEDELAKAESEILMKQRISQILQKSDFGNTKGYSSFMVAFARQIPAGLWLTGFDIDGGGTSIGLQGRTLKPELVPVYVNQLKRESVMQGISFSNLEMQLPQIIGNYLQNKVDAAKHASEPETPLYIEFDLRSSDDVGQKNLAGAAAK